MVIVLCPKGGDGANSYNGIVNIYAQGASFVNDVTLCDIGVTGLKITSTASGSGPYTNINFVAAPGTTSSETTCSGGLGEPCTACVDIEAQTLGLHGITCIGAQDVSGVNGSSSGDAAIYVNASNNSVEDVHVEAFWDAIEVGDTTASTVGNVVISNVRGSVNGNTPSLGPVTNEVHICGSNDPQSGTFGACAITTGTVRDVTILAANDYNNGINSHHSTSVLDDVTGTVIPPPSGQTQSLAAIYALGYQIGGGSGGYSRFATTPSATSSGTLGTMVPTWSVGNASVTNNSCSTPGAIYSNTDGETTPKTSVYVCTFSGSAYEWEPII